MTQKKNNKPEQRNRCTCSKPEVKTSDNRFNMKYCGKCMEVISYETPEDEVKLEIVSKKDIDKENKVKEVAEPEVAEVEVVTDLFGTREVEVKKKGKGKHTKKRSKSVLRQRFLEPTFTVLNARGGEWQDRKRDWTALGIQSEVSREDVKIMAKFDAEKYGREEMPEVSIFDPALCELIYNWFARPNGSILDPFAGGSTRGVVAGYLGYKYTGIDIREEQIISNIEQSEAIIKDGVLPNYLCGDSNQVLDELKGEKYDLFFSCPPYADLEVYSDLKDDISNMPYEEFMPLYTSIIKKGCARLKHNRYAVFVVGDVRDKDGYYYDFVGDTKKAFYEAGLKLYNEAILMQPLGTAMLRSAKIFESSRKLTKVHENILVFKKP